MSINPKVLVVDDYLADREIIKEYLIEEDIVKYEFIEAESVNEALEQYDIHNPKCIVLDYFLGDDTGSDFLEQLREKHPEHSPVIIITGKVTKEITIETYEKGVACVFDKGNLSPRILRGLVQHIVLK